MSFSWHMRRLNGPTRHAPQRRRPNQASKHRCWLAVELLETRTLLSVAVPTYVVSKFVNSLAAPSGVGYLPSQIRHAYGFDQINFGSVAGDGTGTTIAIVDAYDDPNLVSSSNPNFKNSDLGQFDAQLGIADPPSFTKVNQNGGTSMPAADPNWAVEISLDVEWAHAIAPGAKILLVEANTANYSDLLTAVSYAANASNVVTVSMSWGGSEFPGENSYDSYFTTPQGHGGVTFVAAAGDSGAPPIYPGASPNVVAVGGTRLTLNPTNNTIYSESGWTDGGGGISSNESQPAYQKGVVSQSSTARTNPDVSFDADPATGFAIYDTYGTGGTWGEVGGTSAGSPQWAALIAIADQGRALAGKSALDGPSQTLPLLYGLPSGDFHDITTGNSYGSPSYAAGPGYDLVTGIGTPVANNLVADLVGGTTGAPRATHFSVVANPTTITAGGTVSVTVTALDASNNTVPGYTGTIHFTSTDPNATLPPDFTFTTADNGTNTFNNIKLTKAGNQTITVTDTGNSSVTGSTTVTVNPGTSNQLVFSQQPTSTTVNATIAPAVSVKILDSYGNLLSSDNTDQVSVAFGANPGTATLGGTTTVTVKGGIATFSNLTVNKAGTGYTLVATLSGLSVTSTAFNISTSSSGGGGGSGTIIEDFESPTALSHYYFVGPQVPPVMQTSFAAHDGREGLLMDSTQDWIFRNDAAATVRQGDIISTWVQMYGAANGRAYFGFGASAAGTLSLVLAPNSGNLIIQSNLGYGYNNLAEVPASFLANHWYRMEVDWGTDGTIVGKVFDSNGTTLWYSVTAKTTVITSGGIAFRSFNSGATFWDTVTDNRGGDANIAQGKTDPISSPPPGNNNPALNQPGATAPAFQVVLVGVPAPAQAPVALPAAVVLTPPVALAPAIANLFIAAPSRGEDASLGGSGIAAAAVDGAAADAAEKKPETSGGVLDFLLEGLHGLPVPATSGHDAGASHGDLSSWLEISEAYFAAGGGAALVLGTTADALAVEETPPYSADNLAGAAELAAALGLLWVPATEGRPGSRKKTRLA